MALYRSPDYQTCFESTDLSVLEKNLNINFQDGGHLGFPIRMILAAFDLQVTLILPMKFQVSWPFGSGHSLAKYLASRGRSLPELCQKILGIKELAKTLLESCVF